MPRDTAFIRSHGYDPRGPDADARSRQAAQRARADAIHAAILDESARLNAAIELGATAVLDTMFGPYQVARITGDMWALCHRLGSPPRTSEGRGFALCDDATWRDLLDQAGVSRHPIFEP